MALYDAASGLIVSWLIIYPSNEPLEACSGKYYLWLLYAAVFQARRVHLHASLYLYSHWMTVMDNLGEKPCNSSNHAFPGPLINSPVTHWEFTVWVQLSMTVLTSCKAQLRSGLQFAAGHEVKCRVTHCQGQGWLRLPELLYHSCF